MLYIPPTSKDIYVSSKVALNIHSPDDTGDWHSSVYLDNDRDDRQELFIFGTGQRYNTNSLLGSTGVIDGTDRLNKMGYYPENSPVWIAEHPRACVDYLFISVLQSGELGYVMLDEWFPSIEDKKRVYELIDIMENKLSQRELEILEAWKKKNPIAE